MNKRSQKYEERISIIQMSVQYVYKTNTKQNFAPSKANSKGK